jgi:hypothetical protein
LWKFGPEGNAEKRTWQHPPKERGNIHQKNVATSTHRWEPPAMDQVLGRRGDEDAAAC